MRLASISAAFANEKVRVSVNTDVISLLTLSFCLSLCLRRLALSADLREACEIGLSLIGLALLVELRDV